MLQASHDANNAATTRRQRTDEIRNRDVREAYQLVKDGRRAEARALLHLSVHVQAHLEGVILL